MAPATAGISGRWEVLACGCASHRPRERHPGSWACRHEALVAGNSDADEPG